MASLVTARRQTSSDFSLVNNSQNNNSAHHETTDLTKKYEKQRNPSGLIIEKDIYTYDPRIENITESKFVPVQGHRRSKSGSKFLSKSGNTSLITGNSLDGRGSDNFVEELGRRISEMSRAVASDASSEDVWAQLQQKEADLLLAAELGKALLEKNEELTKQQERLVEQYSSKLEILTAVRFYAIGSYQRGVGREYDLAVSQSSVSRCVNAVSQAIHDTLLTEWVKFPMTSQERSAAKQKFENARQPFPGTIGAIDCTHVKIIAPKEHEEAFVNHHGYHSMNVQMALEQEKHLLRRRLQATEEESEARLLELQSDVRELSTKLDQRDTNVKQSEREKTSLIAELTAQNSRLTTQLKDASQIEIQLTAQLQGLKDQCSLRKTSLQDHVSSLEALKEELQLVSDKKTELERRLQTALNDRDSLAAQLEEASDRVAMLERHIREQELKYQNSFTDMERLQRENSTLNERLGGGTNSGPFGIRRSLHAELETGHPTSEDGVIHPPPASEILHVYKQLRQLCSHLRSSHDDDSGLHSDLSLSSMEGGEHGVQLRAGVLAEVTEELALLVSGMEGVRFKDMLEKLSHQLHDRDADLQAKNDQILELQKKISVWEVELASAREEANSARADAAGGELARDAAVAEARAARDAAVARRTRAEGDAARARVELAQAAGQLLEAVRQKVELSQQLDQWQMDMQELIEEQMKNKLVSQERKRKVANNGKAESVTTTTTSKILGFFQR